MTDMSQQLYTIAIMFVGLTVFEISLPHLVHLCGWRPRVTSNSIGTQTSFQQTNQEKMEDSLSKLYKF